MPVAEAVSFTSLGTKEYSGHKKKVHTVSWSCRGHKLASGSVDQTVRVWSIDQAGSAKSTELTGHSDSVDQLRWDPTNAEVLGTASGDKTVRIWDTRAGGKCAHAIDTLLLIGAYRSRRVADPRRGRPPPVYKNLHKTKK